MTRLFAVLAALSAWADRAKPRTWLLHALIAVPIMLLTALELLLLEVLGVFTPLTAGAVTAKNVYLVRELEQIAHRRMRGLPLDPVDHVMDVVAPALVVVGLAIWWTRA